VEVITNAAPSHACERHRWKNNRSHLHVRGHGFEDEIGCAFGGMIDAIPISDVPPRIEMCVTRAPIVTENSAPILHVPCFAGNANLTARGEVRNRGEQLLARELGFVHALVRIEIERASMFFEIEIPRNLTERSVRFARRKSYVSHLDGL